MELDSRIGELAALGTALCWCASTLFFEVASRRIGSLAVNLIRLGPALAGLTLYGLLVHGRLVPEGVSPTAWGYLIVSGWVGFVIGDMCLFKAYVLVGGRLSALVMALWPSMAAVISWLVLGETLSGWDVLGMSLTFVGIAIAVGDRQPSAPGRADDNFAKGIVLAFGGALGQAGGLVLSKIGMGKTDAFAATQIRVLAAIVGFAVVFTAIGWWPKVAAGLRQRRAVAYTTAGAMFGPFVGVSLSLYAVQHTETGIGASIMATTPILLIPVAIFIHKERVGAMAIFGSFVAVGGVAALFLF